MSIWCHVSSVQVSCIHVMYLIGPFPCRPIITPSQRCHSNSHSHPSMTAAVSWCQKACPRRIITVERFRGYRGDTRCKKCGWFGHRAHHYRRAEIKAEWEQREGLFENRWELLRCRVIACEKERMAARSVRREVQQLVKCWGCREQGYCL